MSARTGRFAYSRGPRQASRLAKTRRHSSHVAFNFPAYVCRGAIGPLLPRAARSSNSKFVIRFKLDFHNSDDVAVTVRDSAALVSRNTSRICVNNVIRLVFQILVRVDRADHRY